jgi:hypothetical protein
MSSHSAAGAWAGRERLTDSELFEQYYAGRLPFEVFRAAWARICGALRVDPLLLRPEDVLEDLVCAWDWPIPLRHPTADDLDTLVAELERLLDPSEALPDDLVTVDDAVTCLVALAVGRLDGGA